MYVESTEIVHSTRIGRPETGMYGRKEAILENPSTEKMEEIKKILGQEFADVNTP